MARILHLAGSPTSRFWAELSLLYARGALGALGAAHDFINCVALPDGSWRFASGLDEAEIAASPTLRIGEALDRMVDSAPDCVLPQMFCHRGMTAVRAMVEGAGLPLLGNTGAVMAIAADKALAKAIVAAAGVATPASQVLCLGEAVEIDPPFIVKPVLADNSHGLALVLSAADIPAALEQGFAAGERVLAEQFIAPGREVRAGVIEQAGRLRALPLEEYAIATDHPVRLAGDKLTPGADGGLSLMAKTPEAAWIVPESDAASAPVQAAALACHRALGCRDYSLFDFRIDERGKPWFLEAGPYCSFAPDSVLVTMMEAAGTQLSYFFDAAVEQVRARHDRD